LYPTRSTGVDEVVTCLERQAVCFGNPHRIVSDRGAAFTSHLFKEYCDTIAECMKAFGTNPASGGPILGCGTGETMTTRSGLTY